MPLHVLTSPRLWPVCWLVRGCPRGPHCSGCLQTSGQCCFPLLLWPFSLPDRPPVSSPSSSVARSSGPAPVGPPGHRYLLPDTDLGCGPPLDPTDSSFCVCVRGGTPACVCVRGGESSFPACACGGGTLASLCARVGGTPASLCVLVGVAPPWLPAHYPGVLLGVQAGLCPPSCPGDRAQGCGVRAPGLSCGGPTLAAGCRAFRDGQPSPGACGTPRGESVHAREQGPFAPQSHAYVCLAPLSSSREDSWAPCSP